MRKIVVSRKGNVTRFLAVLSLSDKLSGGTYLAFRLPAEKDEPLVCHAPLTLLFVDANKNCQEVEEMKEWVSESMEKEEKRRLHEEAKERRALAIAEQPKRRSGRLIVSACVGGGDGGGIRRS